MIWPSCSGASRLPRSRGPRPCPASPPGNQSRRDGSRRTCVVCGSSAAETSARATWPCHCGIVWGWTGSWRSCCRRDASRSRGPTSRPCLPSQRFCGQPSELGVAEHWFESTALDDLLGVGHDQINDDRLYRGLDRLAAHKDKLCAHLMERYRQWFGVPAAARGQDETCNRNADFLAPPSATGGRFVASFALTLFRLRDFTALGGGEAWPRGVRPPRAGRWPRCGSPRDRMRDRTVRRRRRSTA